jgi:predicted LPLAT superfamily acyltransferase
MRPSMNNVAGSSWVDQRERGSSALLRFMVWLTLTFGRPVGRLLLHPIALYFVVFSRAAAAASRQYLRIVLGRAPRIGHLYRHYLTFSQTILDRLYFLTDRFNDFDVEIVGAEHVEALSERQQGCVLLGSHLGSFEVLRCLGAFEKKVPVRALYYAHNSDRIDAMLRRLNPASADLVIQMGSWKSMIEAKEFLEQGGMVGVLGDRAFPGGPTIEADFFGRPAQFPEWPVRFALAADAPVILFFGLYLGGRTYRIVFEPFAEASAGRSELRSEPAAFVARYAAALERHCRTAPYNWFNFYDFWRGEARSGR